VNGYTVIYIHPLLYEYTRSFLSSFDAFPIVLRKLSKDNLKIHVIRIV